MKKSKIYILSIISFLLLFIFGSSKVYAAESKIETTIKNEVQAYVNSGTLEDFHLDLIDEEGYQTYYWKMVHLSDNLDYFASQSFNSIFQAYMAYENELTETWNIILSNLDIEPEYLNKDEILGLYWDSCYGGSQDVGYLYFIWTSKYCPSEFMTVSELKLNGNTYKLYDTEEDAENLNANWFSSMYYHFKEYDLTVHITPIAGYQDGKQFGVPLTKKYKFEGFTAGLDDAEYGKELDETKQFDITNIQEIEYDLGLTPTQNGKNACQLSTHGYKIIKECEAQSFWDWNYMGYKHYVYFNTTLNIDKIYRVDVSYILTNDDKPWYQFYLSDTDEKITKSLAGKRQNGGFLGLSSFTSFTEGSYQSTKDDAVNYKYRLHLNYDDDGWQLHFNNDIWESDYRRISQFKILRMNFLIDNETYDVAIDMDTIEGDTLFILDPDLILDTDTWWYDFKNTIDDALRNAWDKYQWVLWVLVGVLGISLILWIWTPIKKVLDFITFPFRDKD